MSYENLNKFIDYLRKIQESNMDALIGVTGPRGMGKSSFAIQIARRYVERYFGEPSFNIRKYIAFDNDEVLEKIHTLPVYSPLIGDEAARFAMGEDWNKAESKELKKVVAQIRPKRLIFFLNLPKLNWLDKKYREEMVKIWVWIPTREYALIFEPDMNPGIDDSWHLNEFKRFSKKRLSHFSDIDRILKIARRNPCFMDYFKFPKVPEELYDRYEAIRNARAFESKPTFINQKEVARTMVYNLKYNWDGFLAAVNKSKNNRPTFDIMEDHLVIDPRTKEKIASSKTFSKWNREMNLAIRNIETNRKPEPKLSIIPGVPDPPKIE